MLIDSASAIALAGIIFASTQGVDDLKSQSPLQIVDRGESSLVKGTPYTDTRLGAKAIASLLSGDL